MQLRIEVGGIVHIVDLAPNLETPYPVPIKITILDENNWHEIVTTQRIVYIRNGEIKVS